MRRAFLLCVLFLFCINIQLPQARAEEPPKPPTASTTTMVAKVDEYDRCSLAVMVDTVAHTVIFFPLIGNQPLDSKQGYTVAIKPKSFGSITEPAAITPFPHLFREVWVNGDNVVGIFPRGEGHVGVVQSYPNDRKVYTFGDGGQSLLYIVDGRDTCNEQ